MKCLSLFDLTGIQDYVFGTSTLKANVGASYLAKSALDSWLQECVLDTQCQILWTGGGNAMVQTPDTATAIDLTTRLHSRIWSDAPGLGLACTHQAWDGDPQTYSEVANALFDELDRVKRGRWPDASFDGGGVTARCKETDEPVIANGKGRTLIAREQKAERATQRLTQDLDLGLADYDLEWTAELGKLGRTVGERSLLGVIHFDGNRMGKRFQALTQLDELQRLSRAVDAAGLSTLKKALAWLLERLPKIRREHAHGGFELAPTPNANHAFFPVRPILYGGDDMTLVADARIALDLGAKLLELWQTETADLPDGKGPAHACVGVAIVKVQYPFFRAYELSEALCKNAKTAVWERDASALDWEIISGGGTVDLALRRMNERTWEGAHRLTGRPYVVCGEVPAQHRRWSWFSNTLLQELQGSTTSRDEHQARHTKLKGLADSLRAGPRATQVVLDRWKDRFNFSVPMLPGHSEIFSATDTPYLDALELMDLVVPRALLEVP